MEYKTAQIADLTAQLEKAAAELAETKRVGKASLAKLQAALTESALGLNRAREQNEALGEQLAAQASGDSAAARQAAVAQRQLQELRQTLSSRELELDTLALQLHGLQHTQQPELQRVREELSVALSAAAERDAENNTLRAETRALRGEVSTLAASLARERESRQQVCDSADLYSFVLSLA